MRASGVLAFVSFEIMMMVMMVMIMTTTEKKLHPDLTCHM